jgi:hypothetical protein
MAHEETVDRELLDRSGGWRRASSRQHTLEVPVCWLECTDMPSWVINEVLPLNPWAHIGLTGSV